MHAHFFPFVILVEEVSFSHGSSTLAEGELTGPIASTSTTASSGKLTVES